jgi:hypothetical protein
LLGSSHYEKTGIFIVHSAYKLGLHHPPLRHPKGPSSSYLNVDKDLAVYLERPSPPRKPRFFASKLATESLAVQKNRQSRNMDTKPTCNICGLLSDDGYHR